MFRLTLRKKLLIFAIAIAVVPLVVAGRTIIQIAQDELKSSANEALSSTADDLVREIDHIYQRAWLAPLVLIRNAIDGEMLGVQEKIALLTLGIRDIPDIVALQITVEGASLPLLVTQDDFANRLSAAGGDPLTILRIPAGRIAAYRQGNDIGIRDTAYIAETGDWLATIVLPLNSMIAGADATLSARIDLSRLKHFVEGHAFRRLGEITIVDASGQRIFDPGRADIGGYPIVEEATRFIGAGTRLTSVEPYTRPDGTVMLGAFAFPQVFDWAVLVEKNREDAYLAIVRMTESLVLWGLVGITVAMAGAAALALAMSRPILEMERVADAVVGGDFSARVQRGIGLHDEIGDLARRLNFMITGLNERFQLEKFVSSGTVAAIKGSDLKGVKLGGERRAATMLFCDIRGYTAFSETQPPDVVVEVLNYYFQHLTEIIIAHDGDIDKFVGDEILAVFQGEEMARHAVLCALSLQAKMAELGADRPDWHLAIGIGINSGEVTMGAMGSTERMDYTVLGAAVNLAARLCSHAGRGQVLMSESTVRLLPEDIAMLTHRLEPLRVKGKTEPVPVFEIAADRLALIPVACSPAEPALATPGP